MIGLLSWLLIASELVLIAAELNVVLARRLWPRSLTGELLEGDKHALRDSARAAQLDSRQRITVSFQRSGARRPRWALTMSEPTTRADRARSGDARGHAARRRSNGSRHRDALRARLTWAPRHPRARRAGLLR